MKLFLSYAPEDVELAKTVEAALKTAGHEVSLEVDGIGGGQNWQRETREAIQTADWVVVLVSQDYIDAQLTRWELFTALELQKAILPVVIRPTPFSILNHIRSIDISADLPSGFRRVIEFFGEQAKLERAEYIGGQLKQLADTFGRLSVQVEQGKAPDRVFIAYSRKQRPIAEALHALLTQNGKAVFWDAKIKAGATWRQTIQKALDDATHLIVIWTKDAAESDEVEREVSYALAKRKTIIPILSQEFPELPYHLYGLHYLVLQDDLKLLEKDLLGAIAQFASDDDLYG